MGLGPKTHLIHIYPIWSFIVQVLSGFSGTKEDFFFSLFVYLPASLIFPFRTKPGSGLGVFQHFP